MIFVNLTLIFCLDIFADKDHVSPKLNHTNIQALNYLLRLEIFVSKDRQLRATPLILDYEPLSRTFQDVGQAIKADSPRLGRLTFQSQDFWLGRIFLQFRGQFHKIPSQLHFHFRKLLRLLQQYLQRGWPHLVYR